MNEPASPESSPWIIDADARNFEKEVLGRSMELPVVVDFWAEWCSPCKALGPILEKAAREGNGRFLLAKVDVDKNPELAQVFRVQSIPMVVALADGRLADAFTGALPPAEVLAFLDRVAPGGAKPGGNVVEEASNRATEGDVEGAIGLLREHLRGQPEDVAARIALGGHLLDAGKVEDARRLLEKLEGEAAEESGVPALRTRLALVESAGNAEELRAKVAAAPEDAALRLDLGRALVASRAYEEGLEELLEAVRLEAAGAGTEARQTMLETFEILGLEDPVANDFRFRLSLLLFS